eukprot:3741664-Pleurochrysis_carterae.AAC.1
MLRVTGSEYPILGTSIRYSEATCPRHFLGGLRTPAARPQARQELVQLYGQVEQVLRGIDRTESALGPESE